MNREQEIIDAGSRLGSEAVEHIAQRAEDYCECERQRLELVNQARINALHIEGSHLKTVEDQLQERLRHVAPPSDVRRLRAKAPYYWITGLALTVAAFFFSLIAFAPYRLGWKGDLYCLGIALVTPFAVEEFLEAWKSQMLLKIVVTTVFLAALIGGALLAAMRGDLLSEQVKQASPAVVIDEETASPSPPQDSFYESTRDSLRMLMLFLALAIDLGAGVALHRALALGALSGEDYDALFRELTEVRQRLAAVVYEITMLSNAPAIFVARFWRDFYRAMLTQAARKAAAKLLGLSFCLLLLLGHRASAQNPLNIVAAIDLSTSEAAKGYDEKSEFSRNALGVKRLLTSLPAGSRITVIGITDRSFAQPCVLLSAEIADDPGYFGERLAAARQQLVGAWERRASRLEPNARGTDILGALLLTSEIFRHGPPGRRVLVLYSDMRHATRELDLEAPGIVHVDSALATIERCKLLADLKGVTAYVVGANAWGNQVAAWASLKQLWTAYFSRAGANLAGYSILCEPPKLVR